MKHERPADIERTSMAIITQELADLGIELPPDEAPVIKRVIHTSADFDYAKNLVFTPNAVPLAQEALRRGGMTIITDTNMAKAGVSRVGLEKLGGQVLCFMADPDIAQRAKNQGSTRAVAAMQKAAQAYPARSSLWAMRPRPSSRSSDRWSGGFAPPWSSGCPWAL